LADVVDARWVSVNAVHKGKHRGPHLGVEGRGGVVIEINRAHGGMMPEKSNLSIRLRF
jgi:hypothetical protein